MTATIHLGDDAHPYLPDDGCTMPPGEPCGGVTCIARHIPQPPERVWVPWSDDLPVISEPIKGGRHRPLAPGDVVTLTGDCNEPHESLRHLCVAGRVEVGSARVAEIVRVHDLDMDPVPDGPHLTQCDGVALGVYAGPEDDVGRFVGAIPGDWSSARWGIRLEVEAT